jgi:hypothetical protein
MIDPAYPGQHWLPPKSTIQKSDYIASLNEIQENDVAAFLTEQIE